MLNHIGPLYWLASGQDLRERANNPARVHARGWVIFYWGDPNQRGRELIDLHAETVIGRRDKSAALQLTVGEGDGNDGVMFTFKLPGFSLYLSAEGVLPKRLQPRTTHRGFTYPEPRELGVRIFGGNVWWHLWSAQNEWDSERNWRNAASQVRMPVWHVTDWVLGKEQTTKSPGMTHHASITHNGQVYPVTIAFTHLVYRRPRWPRRKHITRANIEMTTPIPVPSSESMYDLTGDPDDAIHSMSCPAATVEEALAQLRESLERDR